MDISKVLINLLAFLISAVAIDLTVIKTALAGLNVPINLLGINGKIQGNGFRLDKKEIFIEGDDINLKCSLSLITSNLNETEVKLEWKTPRRNRETRKYDSYPGSTRKIDDENYENILKIYNASSDLHSGTYYCYIMYNNAVKSIFINVQIWDKLEIHNMKIKHTGGLLEAGQNFTLTCEYDLVCNVRRSAKVTWTRPNNQYYNNNNRTSFNRKSNCLKDKVQRLYNNINILNANIIKDTGSYQCSVGYTNKDNVKKTNLFITIIDTYDFHLSPMNLTITVLVGNSISIAIPYTKANGSPDINVVWNKLTLQNEKQNTSVNITSKPNNTKVIFINDVGIDDTGNYSFSFSNAKYRKTLVYQIFVEDKPHLRMESVYVKQGNKALFECIAKANPEPNFMWHFIPLTDQWNEQNSSDKSEMFHFYEAYQNDLNFKLNTLKQSEINYIGQLNFIPNQNGLVNCTAINLIGKSVVLANVTIGDIKRPFDILVRNESLQNEEKDAVLGEEFTLECAALITQYYNNITWLQADKIVVNSSDILLFDDKTNFSYRKIMKFPNLKPENLGNYECMVYALDSEKPERRRISIKITTFHWWYYMFVVLGIILFLLILGISIRLYHEKQKWKKMKLLGIENFKRGATESINPNLTVAEQADLLPYDKNIEIPKKKIELGNILGNGAFGVVYEGFIKNLMPGESKTIVAVKMIKTDNNIALKSLLSELKIMIHLGKHVNVVNLLGAVTKNITQRELMIVVEYCKYGNIKAFLMRNSKNFINQIDTKTDLVDSNISGTFPTNKIQPAGMTSIDFTMNRQCNLNEYSPDHGASSSRFVFGRNRITSDQSDNRFAKNLDKSNDELLSPLTTSNLVSWIFQVACGMDYLASRKVLHGDLAARNILLCEDNIVKISDFGLSKSIMYMDNYKKNGKTPLPIKWLAIESLRDSTFSTRSDVWAFGITMWEIFSLGKVPYPGIIVDNLFLEKLQNGYRMAKPKFANEKMYKIMLECWDAELENRPKFSALQKRLSELISKAETSTKLSNSSMSGSKNLSKTSKKSKDYLNLMSSPDGTSSRLPSPANNDTADNLPPNGYLPMLPIKPVAKSLSVYANDLNSLRQKNSHRMLVAEEMLFVNRKKCE